MVFLSDDQDEHNRLKSQNFEKYQTLIDIIYEIF